MNLAPRPVANIGQRLVLAPRQSESLQILALPATDLAALIAARLETNPLLEREEFLAADPRESDGGDDGETPWWDESAAPTERGLREPQTDDDLYSYLGRQLLFERLNEREEAAALAVIEALDEDGYLRCGNASLAAGLGGLTPPLADEEIEAGIARVQRFDPAGVAARSVAECLLLQLTEYGAGTPGLALARRLVGEHCETLARPDRVAALGRLGWSGEELDAALALIHGLDPYPGNRIGTSPVRHLIPDLVARPGPGGWRVNSNPAAIPRLCVNESYAAWLGAHRGEGNCTTLMAQLEEARWLLRSLAQRRDTMLRIGAALVERQSAFLEAGAGALLPLTRSALAADLHLHESTVARAVQHKSLAAPRGIIPLRNFFSNAVSRQERGDLSAGAVQAEVKTLIAAENRAHPLSDAALAQALATRGMHVARRTVTKYRETAGLPSARHRRDAGRHLP